MNKKKLHILLFFVLLVALLGTCSVGYGATFYNIDDLAVITQQVINNGQNSSIIEYATFFKNYRYDLLKAYVNTNNIDFSYNQIFVKGVRSGSDQYYEIYCCTGTPIYYASGTGNFQIGSRRPYEHFTIDYNGNISYSSGSTARALVLINGYAFLNSQCWGLTDYTMDYADYSLIENFDLPLVLPLNYIVSHSASNISVNVNGSNRNFNLLNYNRSVGWWYLGSFNDFDDYVIECNFGPYVAYDVMDTSQAQSNFNSEGRTINSDRLALVKTSQSLDLYVNNYWLLYNQGYDLLIQYRKKDSDSWADLQYDYYFLPVGVNSISGDLVNSNLNSDIDLDFVRSIDALLGNTDFNNDLINQTYEDYFYNFNVSGDYFSGDIFNAIGFVDYTNNDYDLVIYRIFKKVVEAIKNDTGNPYISFTYRNNTYTIYANDLTVPDSPLKYFISTFLIAGFIYLIIYRFYAWFIMLTTVDLYGSLNSFNVDESVFI